MDESVTLEDGDLLKVDTFTTVADGENRQVSNVAR